MYCCLLCNRKWATHELLSAGIRFYACSLSSRTFVYKGQFSPKQLWAYFLDLHDDDFECFLALVHARFSTNTFPNWDRAQPLRLLAHNGEINTLRGNVNSMAAREGNMHSSKFSDLSSLYPIVEPDSSDSGSVDNVLEFLVRAGSDRSLPEAMVTMVPEAGDLKGTKKFDKDGDGEKEEEELNLKEAFYKWSSLRIEPWDGPALFTFSDGRFVGAILDRNGLRPSRYVQTTDGLVVMASEVGVIDFISEDFLERGMEPDEQLITVPNGHDEPQAEGIGIGKINHLGRLRPGRMLLVDTEKGILIRDDEVKRLIYSRRDYCSIVKNEFFTLSSLLSSVGSSAPSTPEDSPTEASLDVICRSDGRLALFGYTSETIELLLKPMTDPNIHKEALGSMGNDAALACISEFQPLIYEYFKQVFAQVTNPPIDPFREKIVMSLAAPVGPEPNILEPSDSACRLWLDQPILSNSQTERIKSLSAAPSSQGWTSRVINCVFPINTSSPVAQNLQDALVRVCDEAKTAARDSVQLLILSDRLGGSGDKLNAPIPALLSLGAVHHSLIASRQRNRVALIVETGEAREIHHLALLLGYGADAINPYLVFETMCKVHALSPERVFLNYRSAVQTGLFKVMAKMGISTLQSYKGAQIFEAVGLADPVIDFCFKNTASRVGGSGFLELATEVLQRYALAYSLETDALILRNPGQFHWRAGGEMHVNEPQAVALLQEAAKNNSVEAYKSYVKWSREAVRKTTLRGQLQLIYSAQPISEEEVEDSVCDIMRRFCTGAMSFGSISIEAHEALARAMNQIGGKSNTGEGGENERRYRDPHIRSKIKQIASGRFGVTAAYLANADELQIKMAQGAKPGEGGELPGHKVTADIADVRKSVPGVGLISPPPHHDIYSIEDLAELIYDLKCCNPSARISVKLVSVVGVGVVAAGVAKGKAEHITISGHDGGTGASSWTGIKGAGIPWELGLSETHQVLVANDLRSRVTLQVDGQLRTAFDVITGAALGADEFAFSTAPLIVLGCTMMRKCHLNTCPVGVATQDPVLRARFTGQPEHVINYFYLLASEIRSEMAKLGIRRFNDLIGRTDLLKFSPVSEKAARLNLDAILCDANKLNLSIPSEKLAQEFNLHSRKDNLVIDRALAAGLLGPDVKDNVKLKLRLAIRNIDRCFATTVSYEIVKQFGENGLPDGSSLSLRLKGSAGQSLGAWICRGISIILEGEANDYVGKGLSGGKITLFPPKLLTDQEIEGHWFRSENNVICGNVCLYGATSGTAFIRGLAGERFAVRNSGATAVVEGVGDHGCEYMTGGKVVILGDTGRNFGAGMSGGIAWVYTFPPYNLIRDRADPDLRAQTDHLFSHSVPDASLVSRLQKRFSSCFARRANLETIQLYGLETGHLFDGCSNQFDPSQSGLDDNDEAELQLLIKAFQQATGSLVASKILEYWPVARRFFLKVYPRELQEVHRRAKQQQQQQQQEQQVNHAAEKPAAKTKAVDIEDTILDKTRGFLKYPRIKGYYRRADDRLNDWSEVYDIEKLRSNARLQATRCMDCGIPFCQSTTTGCPLGNIIPSFNDLVHKGRWREASLTLLQTNNFPEFTGRVCPAPCEGSCVLGINSDPVAIKSIEMSIAEHAFDHDIVGDTLKLKMAAKSGYAVAVIGAGPAGLAAAAQLALVGHSVTVFDRQPLPGGLLQYGIPNMKLDKGVIKRRIDLMKSVQGITFQQGVDVGSPDFPVERLEPFHAITLCVGATWPRDLNIPGRTANGIHFAMEYLGNERCGPRHARLSAKGKKVIVIGGGDTGCDCIGTALREGAESVIAFEILPQPPPGRAEDNPWPQWPKIFRVDYGHEEVKLRSGSDPRLYEISR